MSDCISKHLQVPLEYSAKPSYFKLSFFLVFRNVVTVFRVLLYYLGDAFSGKLSQKAICIALDISQLRTDESTNRIGQRTSARLSQSSYQADAYDIMAAILLFQNNETAAMLV